MGKLFIVSFTCLALLLTLAVAAPAQTKPTTSTQGTTSTVTSQSTGSTSSSTQGAYDKLSPGNQKIAKALYDAQIAPSGSTSSNSSTQPKPYTLDQIAAMKQHRGWGEIFKEMKANGEIPADVKNLGQLVSGRYQKTSGGMTITSGSGKSEVVGNSGKHEFGSESSHGRGESSGPGSSSGNSGSVSSHGGGPGK